MPMGGSSYAKKGANTDITSLAGHTVNGFTKLGPDAPAIKVKKLTGTTGAVGSSTAYTTGIAKDKIISFTVQVSDSTANWIQPNHGEAGTATEFYYARINSAGNLLIDLPSYSTAVHGCAFICLITYEE